jgi:hypothetical protein
MTETIVDPKNVLIGIRKIGRISEDIPNELVWRNPDYFDINEKNNFGYKFIQDNINANREWKFTKAKAVNLLKEWKQNKLKNPKQFKFGNFEFPPIDFLTAIIKHETPPFTPEETYKLLNVYGDGADRMINLYEKHAERETNKQLEGYSNRVARKWNRFRLLYKDRVAPYVDAKAEKEKEIFDEQMQARAEIEAEKQAKKDAIKAEREAKKAEEKAQKQALKEEFKKLPRINYI